MLILSFGTRIPSHEQWTPAVRLGDTHIHAMVASEEASRLAIEELLIQAFQPALNTQLKQAYFGHRSVPAAAILPSRC